jgi:hypothetical protein
VRLEKLLRRCATLCLHTGYFEEAPKGTADLTIVVDDCDPVFHEPPLFLEATWLQHCVSIGPWSYIRLLENDVAETLNKIVVLKLTSQGNRIAAAKQ